MAERGTQVSEPQDVLYSASLSDFVETRNRLAKNLAAAGKKEEAARVRGTSKPSASVWTVNQVARRAPDVVRRLVSASDALIEAQGRGQRDAAARARYQQAVAAQRGALQNVMAVARQVLAEEGRSGTAAVLEKVANDFRTGALGDESRASLLAGRMTEDLGPQDFGALVGKISARPSPGPGSRPSSPAPGRRPDSDDAQAKAEREHRRQAEARRRAFEKNLQQVRLQVQRARKEVGRKQGVLGEKRELGKSLRAQIDWLDDEIRFAERALKAAQDGLAALEQRERDLDLGVGR